MCCRRSNSIAAEQAGALSNGMNTNQKSENGLSRQQSLSGQTLSSREAVQPAILKQQQASQEPLADGESHARLGIRRGKGSVPAVPKQGKPASGLDRDLRDEIDAW